MMLEHDYRLEFVKTGNEVIQKYFTLEPDLVLMDIMMPEMNGYRAFDEIKKESGDKKIKPIIALTAKAMSGDKEDILAYGFTDYISKPINDEILLSIINKHLN